MASNVPSTKVKDFLFDFAAGMNQGVAPLLLPKNQMASAMNVTVRGTFATHRPAFRRMKLQFATGVQANFEGLNWQGGGYYKPDAGAEQLIGVLGGRFFSVTPNVNDDAWVVEPPLDVAPITPDGAVTVAPYPRPSTQRQAWLWQAEKWMIWNDGISQPVFYDGTDLSQSNFGTAVEFSTDITVDFTVPAIGATVTVTVASIADMVVGDILQMLFGGRYQILSFPGGLTVELLNLTAGPEGFVVDAGVAIYRFGWSHQGTMLPPGRMGTYGMGRVWESLADGKQFIASDLVGGSSGSVDENSRDAVLFMTENLYLAGGGNFTVPGSIGDIKAMRFTATLDASLGQGPLQVLTPAAAFSCIAPVDRLTWQDVENPILTQSLITFGGLSQNATICANGDLMFRSVDGIRSLILGRRDFDTWGNVPQSREIDPLLRRDQRQLLELSSAVVFDNRYLITTYPVANETHGVYWKGLAALNFDPISSLRGKAPSVYDGLWTGLNIFQVITGEFAGIQRCFAFTFNELAQKTELWEILTDEGATADNGTERIVWQFESPVLDFGQKDPRLRQLLRLNDGEIYVDQLLGRVDFKVYYKPDQWPCWVPWHAWTECALAPDATKPSTAGYKAQFRPAMGLGQPSPEPCDEPNDRPLREGYSFQVKVVVTGHCRFLGGKFEAVTIPEPMFAKQQCCSITDFINEPIEGGNPNNG